MGQSERSQNRLEDPFTLTVDQYGRLWLHAKLDGQQVTIDLGEKNRAFQIMAATMADQQFNYHPFKSEHDGQADNDDHISQQPS